MRQKNLDCLFEPIIINNLKLKNRLIMAPMGTGLAGDGFVTRELIDYLAARARGGIALITVEVSAIDKLGKAGLGGELAIYDDKFIPGLRDLSDAIHEAGSKVVIQLNHAGRYARSKNIGAQSVAPSPIRSRYTGETPRELTTEEVEALVQAFAHGAVRAKEANFDGVELMGSTGYLISQFCSSLTNKRTDKYGGSNPAARAAFVKEIIREIRKNTGNDFNICVKMSVDEFLPGGNTIDDSQILGKEFVKAGADRLHAWAGWHESPEPMLPMAVPRAAFAYLSEALKQVVNVPVTAVGRINDPFVAASLIKEKKADLIALGRGLLSDPEFALKASQGRESEIRPCIGCCICFDALMRQIRHSKRGSLICALNPELGREGENLLSPAEQKKKVLIIGGGPGGMEAARVAALKGHQVMLWEKSDRLGGSLLLASIPPLKDEINGLTNYLSHQMEVNKVQVKLNKDVTAKDILDAQPDWVIMAVGAKQVIPAIPGINNKNVVMAIDLLSGKVETGAKAVIIGGGMIGVDVAEYLNKQGKQVTLLSRQVRIGIDIGPSTRWVTMMRIKKSNINIITKVIYKEIRENGILIERNGEERFVSADTIIVSGGLVPDRKLIDDLKGKIPLKEIGDCVKTRQITDAIHEGFEAALAI